MTGTITIQEIGSVARVMLNRPEAHNAMSNQMVEELLDYFISIRDNRGIRVVIIGAEGKSFCSGGDIKDLQASASLTMDEKIATMARFDQLLQTVNQAPQVVITRIQGAAMGGGFGLVCVSDIAIAGEKAQFGLPEVRLGVSPALISPYVISRLGLSRARQLMLTGSRFDAHKALDYELIHYVCPQDELDKQVNSVVNEVLACSPNALAETKALIYYVTSRSIDESLIYRAELISRIRESAEGQEGMMAFVTKQQPAWTEKFEG